MIKQTVVNAEQNKRNTYIDFLKGIAIILMIVGHSISGNRKMDVLFNWIYSFHMPLLFFASAYIEEQNKEKWGGEIKKILLKRINGLLLPYISWTIIYAVISGDLGKVFSSLLGHTGSGLWFLPVLFGLKIMHFSYWLICNKNVKNAIVMDIMILCMLEIILAILAIFTKQTYLINMLSYAIPYFFAVILVKYEIMQRMVKSEWLAASVIFFYVLAFSHFSFYDTHWTTQVVRVALSLCVIVICCKANDSISPWPLKSLYPLICICGENSLAIYVLHGFFMDYKEYFDMMDSAFLTGLLAVGLAIPVAIICIIIAKVIGISSWCGKLLFGK